MATKDIRSHSLEPVNVTLYGKIFADVINDTVTGRVSRIIQVDPKCHRKCPYTRKSEGNFTQKKRR